MANIDWGSELDDFMKVRESIGDSQRQKAAAAMAEREYQLNLEKFLLEKMGKIQGMTIAQQKEVREAELHPQALNKGILEGEELKQKIASQKVTRMRDYKEAKYKDLSAKAVERFLPQGQSQTAPVQQAVPGQPIQPGVPQPTQAGVSFGPSGATITPKSDAEQFLEYQSMLKAADEPRRYKIEQTVKRLESIEKDPFVQDYQEIDRNVRSLIDLHNGVKSGDIPFGGEYTAGILNLYQRLVDPKGVVRSGDLDLIIKNIGLRRQWNVAVQKITSGGGIDKEGAETIMKIGSALGNTYGKKYDEYLKSKIDIADHLGYDKEVLSKTLPFHKPYSLDQKTTSIKSILDDYRKSKSK